MADDDTGPVIDAEVRLAVYGTLAPGKPNHHQLADLTGRWCRGTVRGRLVGAGWGAALGFPGLVLDDEGEVIDVELFESSDLPSHWERLDAFEGAGYKRVTVTVSALGEMLAASVYVVAAEQKR